MIDFHKLSSRLDGLETQRLTIRRAAPVDGWSLFDATRNPIFNRHLIWPKPDQAYQAVQRMESICLAQQQGRLTAVSACLKETGGWCALFRFLPYLRQPGVVEMGLWIHPDYWNSDLGTELTRACMSVAYSFPETDILLGATLPPNKGAIKVLMNCGLAFTEQVIRHHEDGRPADVYEHRITRSRWDLLQFQLSAQLKPLPSLVANQ